jgi:subtilisin family serine protease
MQVSQPFWTSPRQAVGPLPTTGKGVGVVVMDQAFDTRHPDLNHVAAEVGDRFDLDAVGHGSHTLGIVGGSGKSSNGQIQGVAPDATLIPMTINLDEKASWQDLSSQFAGNVYWAVQHREEFNIRVINCSFLLPMVEVPDAKTGAAILMDPLDHAIKMATEAGITIVAGAGNFGDQMPIMTPAGNPNAITVGAQDLNGTIDDNSDDFVAAFSSRGKGVDGRIKPDIVAPGVHIMSANAPGSQLEQANLRQQKFQLIAEQGSMPTVQVLAQKQLQRGRLSPDAMQLSEPDFRQAVADSFPCQAFEGVQSGNAPLYLAQDGTSMAAPMVTGVIANMYEANPDLKPAEVKEILLNTAKHLDGSSNDSQGHGAMQAGLAVQEAINRRH